MDTPDGSPSSPTGRDREKGEDSHEIAAFMRIFMDMVGMSESDSIPAGKFIVYVVLVQVS